MKKLMVLMWEIAWAHILMLQLMQMLKDQHPQEKKE